MNHAMRGLLILTTALTLVACGSDSDDSAVSNDDSEQIDDGGLIDDGDTGGGDSGGGDTGGGDTGGGDTGDGDTDTGGGDTGDGDSGGDSGGDTGEGADDGYGGQPNSAFALLKSRSDLSTLTQAVEAAGLERTLGEAGELTLLAPNNIAFDRLFAELGLSPAQLFADKDLLTAVLRYHVLAGVVRQATIITGLPVTALDGSTLKFERDTQAMPIIYDGRGRLSRVLSMDTVTSNGVVHTVDNVLLPADKNVAQLVAARNDLSLLAEAIAAAGFTETLTGPGPMTLLAPNNDAFISALSELGLTREQLFANKQLLRQILAYHVIPGAVFRAQIPFDQPIVTVQGETLSISSSYPPGVTDARGRLAEIISIDTITTNGIVHIMGRVVLPVGG